MDQNLEPISSNSIADLALETLEGVVTEGFLTSEEADALRDFIQSSISEVTRRAQLTSSGRMCRNLTKNIKSLGSTRLEEMGARETAEGIELKGVDVAVLREAMRFRVLWQLEGREPSIQDVFAEYLDLEGSEVVKRPQYKPFNRFLLVLTKQDRPDATDNLSDIARLKYFFQKVPVAQRAIFVRALFPQISDEQVDIFVGLQPSEVVISLPPEGIPFISSEKISDRLIGIVNGIWGSLYGDNMMSDSEQEALKALVCKRLGDSVVTQDLMRPNSTFCRNITKVVNELSWNNESELMAMGLHKEREIIGTSPNTLHLKRIEVGVLQLAMRFNLLLDAFDQRVDTDLIDREFQRWVGGLRNRTIDVFNIFLVLYTDQLGALGLNAQRELSVLQGALESKSRSQKRYFIMAILPEASQAQIDGFLGSGSI